MDCGNDLRAATQNANSSLVCGGWVGAGAGASRRRCPQGGPMCDIAQAPACCWWDASCVASFSPRLLANGRCHAQTSPPPASSRVGRRSSLIHCGRPCRRCTRAAGPRRGGARGRAGGAVPVNLEWSLRLLRLQLDDGLPALHARVSPPAAARRLRPRGAHSSWHMTWRVPEGMCPRARTQSSARHRRRPGGKVRRRAD